MKLYKYLSDETFAKYLDSYLRGEVYFSSWRDFNDPMEGYFTYVSRQNPKEDIREIIEQKSRYRVCCFCKSYKKFLQWSYYTNGHRGVCLEYNINKTNLPTYIIIKSVNYTKTLPSFNSAASIEDQTKTFLLTKLKVWKPENEVRILGHNILDNTIQIGKLTGIIFGANFDISDHNGEQRKQVRQNVLASGSNYPKLYNAVIDRITATISRRIIDQ
ncbi:MAG: DUF2971 domain-containing protein [archaeon]